MTCNIFKLNFIFHCDRTIVTGLLEENFLKAFKHFINAQKELIWGLKQKFHAKTYQKYNYLHGRQFFSSVPRDPGRPSATNSLVPCKFMGAHLLNVFLALEAINWPVTFNALWKWFKTANNGKLIDAKQPYSFIYKPSHN